MNQTEKTLDAGTFIIIGLDTKDGEEHPRYDERVKLPINQERVANVMEYGILEAVTVATGTKEVIMGRQRVRWAREANKRFEKMSAALKKAWIADHGPGHPNVGIAGMLRVMVPYVEKQLDDVTAYGAMIAENEVRTKDNTMVAARKMETFISVTAGEVMARNPETEVEAAYLQAEKKASLAFGCSIAKVKQYLKLLDLDPVVQAKVEAGELAAYEVAGLRDLAPEEQKRIAEIKAQAKAEGKKVVVEGDGSRKLRAPQALVRKVAAQLGGAAQVAMLWSIGEIDEAAACETKEFAAAIAKVRSAKKVMEED